MERLLKNTSTDPAPGLTHATSGGIGVNSSILPSHSPSSSNSTSPVLTDNNIIGSPSVMEQQKLSSGITQPLRTSLEESKKNTAFQILFNLPSTERVFEIINAALSSASTSKPIGPIDGTLYLSTTFIAFASQQSYACSLVLPFFAIKRVERVTGSNNTIAITVWHAMKLQWALNGSSNAIEKFCRVLQEKLQANVGLMKLLKPFLATCSSEELLAGREVTTGGLGMKYGFVEPRR